MTYHNPEILCRVCGQFHGDGGHASEPRRDFSSLSAANDNVPVQHEPKVRKRMSASEAMAQTKVRYKETLDYLV